MQNINLRTIWTRIQCGLFVLIWFALLFAVPILGQDECGRETRKCDDVDTEVTYIDHIPKDAVIKKVEPIFTDEIRRELENSTAVVKIVIDSKGKILRECFEKGPEDLEEAIIDAVRQWEFKPNFGTRIKFSTKYVGTRLIFRVNRDDDK